MGLNLGLGLQLAPGGHASSSSGSGGGVTPTPALISHINLVPAGPNGGTTGAIDTTGATAIIFAVSGGTIAPTLSDSKGNSYTLAKNTSGSTAGSWIYYCLNPIVGTGHTFTIAGASTTTACCVAAFSGVLGSGALDQTNGGTGTGAGATTIQPGSITPTLNNELLVCALSSTSVASYTINSGFTVTDTTTFSAGNYYGCGLAYLVQTSAAAINPTWTTGGTPTSGNTTTIASFKAG